MIKTSATKHRDNLEFKVGTLVIDKKGNISCVDHIQSCGVIESTFIHGTAVGELGQSCTYLPEDLKYYIGRVTLEQK